MNQKKMKAAAVSATLAFALLATPAWVRLLKFWRMVLFLCLTIIWITMTKTAMCGLRRKKLRLICQDNRQKPMKPCRRFTLPMRNSQRTAVGLMQGQKYSLNLH